MARPLRLEFAGALYHITARGNARQAIVLDDEDRRHFIEWLGREVHQQRWTCYAWCLMDNHYHVLLGTPEANLVAGMRRLNQVYTQHFNRRHRRVGHLFQGRYKSIVVDKESYLLELCRYVVLNAVRAGMARSAREWRWSSYRATAGYVKAPDWLALDRVLDHFGSGLREAQLAYRRFVREGIAAASPWEALRGQIWLGSDAFRKRMARRVAGQNLEAVPKAQTRPDRATLEEVLGAVAAAFAIEPKQVLSRNHQAVFQAAVFLLRRVCNLPLKEVSALAGVSSSRISKIQSHFERTAPSEPAAALLAEYKVKH